MRFARVEYSKLEKYTSSVQKNRQTACELGNITGILRPGPLPWIHSPVLYVTCPLNSVSFESFSKKNTCIHLMDGYELELYLYAWIVAKLRKWLDVRTLSKIQRDKF